MAKRFRKVVLRVTLIMAVGIAASELVQWVIFNG